jgi:hypothetical protein
MPVNLVTALQLREVSDMAHSKSSPGIVTSPLPDSGVLWLDLVFQMDKLNGAIRRFDALIKGNPPSHGGQIHRSGELGIAARLRAVLDEAEHPFVHAAEIRIAAPGQRAQQV